MAANYRQLARETAQEIAEQFLDQIMENIMEGEQVPDDLYNDYPNGDGVFHEMAVDKEYSLLEAANLLDQLGEYEETDEGLWHGQMPRDAISTQAAYTFGNAVMSAWDDVITEINNNREDPMLMDMITDFREDPAFMSEQKLREMVVGLIRGA